MSEIKQHWQKIELNEILSISSKKFNPIGNNENKKCVELEHLSQETGKLLGYTNSSEQQSIKNSFEEGQILFGKLRPYLKKFWKAEFEGVCSSEIWVMNGKKVKNDFLFYLVQTEKFNQIANVSSGSKMPRADWNYMSEIPFDTPPIKEQEKIAEILTTWDEAITKQIELLEAKELLKIALMQKLLSGEVRFGGFTDEWETIKFGKVGEFYLGLTYTPKYVSNGVPFLSVKDLSRGKISFDDTKFISHEEFEKSTNNAKPRKNDILFGRVGTLGNPIIIDFEREFCIFVSLGFLRVNEDINNVFIKYWMNSDIFEKQIESQVSGSSQKNLNVGWLKNFKIKLPSLPEQQKIAEVLSLADDEINLLKNELEELKLQKKALMQKLLTGEVRVKV